MNMLLVHRPQSSLKSILWNIKLVGKQEHFLAWGLIKSKNPIWSNPATINSQEANWLVLWITKQPVLIYSSHVVTSMMTKTRTVQEWKVSVLVKLTVSKKVSLPDCIHCEIVSGSTQLFLTCWITFFEQKYF